MLFNQHLRDRHACERGQRAPVSFGADSVCYAVNAMIPETDNPVRMSTVGTPCSLLICIPTSVKTIWADWITQDACLRTVSFEHNSRLLGIERTAFGAMPIVSMCVPAATEKLYEWSVQSWLLQDIWFERGSKLSRIECAAFARCQSLTSIRLPASLVSLGHRVGAECFGRCDSLSSVTFEPGSRLSRIEASAFHCCPSLLWICLPSSLEVLSRWCFADCSSLQSVTFESHSQLSNLADSTFRRCFSLSSMQIPSSVETHGPKCFGDCHRLSTVTFEDI
jgi:hypothetical protein